MTTTTCERPTMTEDEAADGFQRTIDLIATDMRAGTVNPEAIFWLLLEHDAVKRKNPEAIDICLQELTKIGLS